MTQGWKTAKLEDVCDIIGGGTPSKANSKFYGGTIPWATVRDMKYDVIVETEHKITAEAIKDSATNIIPKKNVIIATRVGLGKVCLNEYDMAINQDLKGIVPRKSSELFVGYLFQWFKSISHLIEEEGTGATVQGVKLPFIRSLSIPLPPIAEQKRLVALLDEAFASISKAKENAEKNLQNSRELFESYLHNIFANPGDGWESHNFESCIENVTYTQKIQRKDFLDSGKYPIVSQEEGIINGYWNKETDIFEIKKPVIIFGDHTKILKYIDFDFVLGADGVKILQPKELLLPKFLYYQLKTAKITSLGYARHYKLLKEMEIKYPDISEQKRIIAKLDELSSETKCLESIYQQKLADIEELKKSILQKAFNGELAGARS